VGGVKATFDGDATGITKAVADTVAEYDKLKRKSDDLNAALKDTGATSSLTVGQLGALKAQAVDAAAKLAAAGGAATSTGLSFASLQEGAKGLQQKLGPMAAAISGISAAMGEQAGAAGKTVAALGQMAAAFGAGGPLGLGIVAAVFAFGAFADAQKDAAAGSLMFAESVRGIGPAMKASVDAGLQPGRDAIKAMTEEFKNFGKSARQITLEAATTLAEGLKARQAAVAQSLVGAQAARNRAFDETATLGAFADEEVSAAGAVFETLTQRSKDLAAQSLEADQALKTLTEGFARADDAIAAQAVMDKTISRQAAAASTKAPKAADVAVGLGFDPGYMRDAYDDFLAEQEAAFSVATVAAQDMAEAIVGVTVSGRDAYDAFLDEEEARHRAAESLAELAAATTKTAAAISMIPSAQAARDVVTATVSGGAGAGGAKLASTVGGVVGSIFGGAAIGEAIGGALGGVLGKALDGLIESLSVLTPLFDAVAVVMQAFQPQLIVLREMFIVLGNSIIAFAPLLLQLAKPWASVTLIVVRLLSAFLPFVDVLVVGLSALVSFVDLLTIGVRWLDEHFFIPLVNGARSVFNGFVDIVNTVVGWIRSIPGFEKFGVMMTHMESGTSSLIAAFDDAAGSLREEAGAPGYSVGTDDPRRLAIEAAKEAAKAAARARDGGAGADAADAVSGMSLTNMPSGFKGAALAFAAADSVSGAGAGLDGPMTMTFNIANWNSKGSINEDVAEIKRKGKTGVSSKAWLGRRQVDDQKG
jgi:hypothetical protein